MQPADGEVLGARKSIDAVCARHGLHRSDLQEHGDLLDFDVGTIDDDAAHVQEVQTLLHSCSSKQGMSTAPKPLPSGHHLLRPQCAP